MRTGSLRLRRFAAWAALCLGLFAGIQAPAQDTYSPEAVRAAYLFHFAGYVEWPDGMPPGPIVIGVLGDRSVAAELRRIVPGREIDGRPVQVRELDAAADWGGIRILYASGAGAALSTLAQKARQQHALLVTEGEAGLSHGAVINFVTVDNRIRFEISLRNAEDTGVKLSSRLLSAALRLKRSLFQQRKALAAATRSSMDG